MAVSRILYVIIILTLFRFVWWGGTFYYDDLNDVNHFFFAILAKSAIASLILYIPLRKRFVEPHHKLIGFMAVVAFCAGWQTTIAHKESNQITNAGAMLRSILNEPLPADKQFSLSEYGDLAPVLAGVHKLRLRLQEANQALTPSFERLVDYCNPHGPSLVDPQYRAKCQQNLQILLGDLAAYQADIEEAYQVLGTELEQMTFARISTQKLVSDFFIANRKNTLAFVENIREHSQQACQTWLAMLTLLNEQDGLFWWDNELTFFDQNQASRFGMLYDKLSTHFQHLQALNSSGE